MEKKILFSLYPARKSDKSTIQTYLAYFDCHLIGTHEKISKYKFFKLITSFIKLGYYGPPISVIIPDFTQCTIAESNKDLISTIYPKSYGDVGIADGHNRLAVIKLLYKLKLLTTKYIPMQILPIDSSNLVKIFTNSEEEVPLTINQICECFKVEDKIIPPSSTSHFKALLEDGSYVRVRDSQQDLIIKKSDFFRRIT